MNSIHSSCPLELMIAEHLSAAGIDYIHESEGDPVSKSLDFYLPSHRVYIEVKGGHSNRIAKQMSRDPNVIAVQGATAARFFSDLLKR